MLDSEKTELMTVLGSNWPSKFESADALDAFVARVGKYTFASVKSALMAHKINSRFAPTISDIEKYCKLDTVAATNAPDVSQYRTLIAQQVAKENPHLRGKPEAELILRYHRFYACRRAGEIQQRIDGMDDSRRAKYQPTLEAELKHANQTAVMVCERDLRPLVGADKSPIIAAWVVEPQNKFEESLLA